METMLLDGRLVPLASTATSEATRIEKPGWLRWNSLLLIQNKTAGETEDHNLIR
ncbi:MAG: hypothetical protein J7J75_01330 [Euryarchaeota archaeon]|nr:hypothetical protein [Euryarchaeota archaeon]